MRLPITTTLATRRPRSKGECARPAEREPVAGRHAWLRNGRTSEGRRSPPMPAALPLPARKPPERGPYQPYEEVWRVQADDDRSGERTGGAGQAERGNDRPVAGQRKPRAGRGGVRRPHACPDPDSAG